MSKIKVLFLAANPADTQLLRLDEEIRAITERIRASDFRDSLELISAWAVRIDDLIQLFNQHKPQVVHFSGHGSPQGEIILVDKNGDSKPVSSRTLEALFSTLKDNIQVVVLNACYSETLAKSITKTIDCVVGMNTAIGDEAAIAFAASFYGAIGFGRSIKGAFDQGKLSLLGNDIPEEDTPELIVRESVDSSQIILVGRSETPVTELKELPASESGLKSADSRIIGTPTIPPAPDYFTNRDEHLEDLQNWLHTNSCFYVIGGPPGRGKTRLTIEFVRTVARSEGNEWFINWIDCKRGDGRIELDYLLESFYDEFVRLKALWMKEEGQEGNPEDELDEDSADVGDSIQEPASRLNSLFRRLKRERWLIILDNYHLIEDAEDDNEIRKFVKRAAQVSGIKLIIVTREAIERTKGSVDFPEAFDGKPLMPIKEDYVLKYLRDQALDDISKEESEKIWKKCGNGEPLAMTIFAGAFNSGRWGKQGLIEAPLPEWSEDRVEEWMQEMTRGLSENAQKVAQFISISPWPVEQEMIEQNCGLTQTQVRQAIFSLIDRFLLFRDRKTGVISSHQLLLEHWQRQWDNQQERDWHVRAASWLETRLSHDEIGLESRSMYLRRAFFHWRKAGDLKRALSCGKDLVKDASLWEEALHSTGQMADPLEILFLTQRIAEIHLQSEEIGQAGHYFQKTLETAQQSGHQQYTAMALHGLGRIAQQQGQIEEAAQRYEGAKLIAFGTGDETQADLVKKVVESFISLREQQAESPRKKKIYDVVEGFYLDAKHLAEGINNEELIRETGEHLGYFYFEVAKDLHAQADSKQAEYWKTKAVNIAKELGNKDMEKEFSSLTDPTGRSFLSYRRSRLHEAELLLAAQHERGIPTWQDTTNLGEEPTEDAIRKALGDRTTANAVLWLTPDVAQSAFIRQIEAPLTLQRARSKDGFFVVPVLAGGLEKQQVASVLDPRFTIEDLEQWNLHKIDADPIGDNEARQVAKWVLRRRLVAIHEALPGNEPLRLELYTRMAPPFKPRRALLMDWSHRFDGREAKPGAWEVLLAALADVEEAVRLNAPGRVIEASGFPAIPAALALGSTFLSPRGMRIRWRQQMQDGTEELWSVDAQPEPSGFQILPPMDRSVDATDLAVLVSVASNVESAFSASLSELPRFRAILHVNKPVAVKHNLENPGQAHHVAQLVVEAIRDVRNRYRQLGLIHLFMAAPVGLAMMIGQLLNTVGPVQTYEHIPIDAVGHYRPAVLLHPSE